MQRPDSTHLSWVTCISFPLAHPRHRGVRPGSAVHSTTPRQRLFAGVATSLALTLVVAPLFTFRYYLLHTRVSAGNVQTAVPGVAGRTSLLPRRSRTVPGHPRSDRRPRRMSKPGERLLVGPQRPATHVVQRRVLLLPVPRAHAVDVLHRDGSRSRQRQRLALGVGGCVVGLGDPHRHFGMVGESRTARWTSDRTNPTRCCARISAK